MYDSPRPLQDLCLDAICERLGDVFEATRRPDDDGLCQRRYRFKQTDLFLYTEISERLLVRLGERRLLDDATIRLFQPAVTSLRCVRLKNAETVSVKGLQVLRGHKVLELECSGMSVNVNDIVGCLSDWSLENLRVLNVTRCTFIDSSRFSGVPALSRLRGLRSLNVAYTEFSQHGLQLVAKDLTALEQLDVSCTFVTDLSPVAALRDRLTGLTVYNFKQMAVSNLVGTVLQLHRLRYLDLSEEKDVLSNVLGHASLAELLACTDALPELAFLDLSGHVALDADALAGFVRAHPRLAFLGLVHSQACYEDMFADQLHPEHRAGLVVAGTATEAQICVALRRYPARAAYVQKCLYYLFRMTPTWRDARPDLVRLVLDGMRAHPAQFGLQLAATACLYNLTKGELSARVHPAVLRDVVGLTLDAMTAFPNHKQLQKNALLTLCSDRVLQDVRFDRYRCAALVLDSLCAFDDVSMNRMAVAICSILAAKISTRETSLLGSNPVYMRKLLQMVAGKANDLVVDITMKFTLSALWNLTDESATTCRVFLDEGGIDLFLHVLASFRDDSTVETKVLGLINNIAEVRPLRARLMLAKFLHQLRSLLRSAHIDVSYFAAGIVSHLASDGAAAWTVTEVTRDDLLRDLAKVVAGWGVPDGEMVAYRSFQPFLPLLDRRMDHPIQLWAVWAIHHVCTKNPKRYCYMLVSEGGVTLLRDLQRDDATDASIRAFVDMVFKVLQAEKLAVQ